MRGDPPDAVVAAIGAGSAVSTIPLGNPPGCIYEQTDQDPNLFSTVTIQLTESPELQREVLDGSGETTEDLAGIGDSAWGWADSDGGYQIYASRGDLSFTVIADSFSPDPFARASALAALVLERL